MTTDEQEEAAPGLTQPSGSFLGSEKTRPVEGWFLNHNLSELYSNILCMTKNFACGKHILFSVLVI